MWADQSSSRTATAVPATSRFWYLLIISNFRRPGQARARPRPSGPSTGLGLALRWIHIYLKPLHQALQLFWLVGCLGWGALLVIAGPADALAAIQRQPIWILAIGPLFAALAGIGFKEFFCFRRPEAIGLTLLLPVALLGHLSGLLPPVGSLALLIVAALLLVVLALRKFGVPAAADVGDKSVFAYLEQQRAAGAP